MNYRHAFHAGNFADVVKHAVLALIIAHLKAKPAPFRVIDTHAGIGLYDLSGGAAQRTGEWRDGIGRIVAAPPKGAAGELLAPYLSAVAAVNGLTSPEHLTPERLTRYPGSPLVTRAGLRATDRATAIELHPEDAATLAALFAGDARLKVVELDGWLAPKSFLPPKERRGLLVIDPPFEAADDYDRIVSALVEANSRFAHGICLIWHPVKSAKEIGRHHAALAATGLRRILGIDFAVARIDPDGPLVACGLTIVNPPWRLAEELDVLLPALVERLATGPGAIARSRWIVPE
jgi:23S rRNA (adenine2030-N6)-methyltransferase